MKNKIDLKEYKKVWYIKNRKELLEKQKDYNKSHKKEIKDYKKEYGIKNKEKISKEMKFYYELHKEEIKQHRDDWYQNNKEKSNRKSKEYREEHIEKTKQYRLKHKKEFRKYIREYLKKRKEVDINFKIICNLRVRLNKTIRNNQKRGTTLLLVGCSIEYLRKYLESQFKKGMLWSNYGLYGWHIDHIKPCCQFDMSKPSEQRKCFHYTNLQPLWAEENLRKSDKIYD